MLTLPSFVNFTQTNLALLCLSLALAAVCLQLCLAKTKLHLIIYMSVFSALSTSIYLYLDAPDVAMTEAALGAAFSTFILLAVTNKLGDNSSRSLVLQAPIIKFILCIGLFGLLIFYGLDLPIFGEAFTPVQQGANAAYLQDTAHEIAIPSYVAAILASYRGFDTLGEASVILIAGIGVFLLTNGITNAAKK